MQTDLIAIILGIAFIIMVFKLASPGSALILIVLVFMIFFMPHKLLDPRMAGAITRAGVLLLGIGSYMWLKYEGYLP